MMHQDRKLLIKIKCSAIFIFIRKYKLHNTKQLHGIELKIIHLANFHFDQKFRLVCSPGNDGLLISYN